MHAHSYLEHDRFLSHNKPIDQNEQEVDEQLLKWGFEKN